MITTRIGHDHFAIWRIDAACAERLVPGATPFISGGTAWLLAATAAFHATRWHGLPVPGTIRTAAWLIPCTLANGRIGNAFVARFVDAPGVLSGWRFAGWRSTTIRLAEQGFLVHGATWARRQPGNPTDDLAWFTRDRCGLFERSGRWWRWPIAKRDWRWTCHAAELGPTPWPARPVGMITVASTVARWGTPQGMDVAQHGTDA